MNFANVTSLTIPEGSVKAIYCNDVKLWGVGGTYENTITGVPPLTLANCTGDDLVSWSMVGNTFQDGTPSPDNVVDVLGTGDWDDTEQKYKIPVVSRGKNLFDTSSVRYEYAIDNTNTLITYNGGCCHFIKCSKNTECTISINSEGETTWLRIGSVETPYVLGKVYNYKNGSTKPSVNQNLTTNTGNYGWVVIQISASFANSHDYKNLIQLELGSTATTYEPYTEPTTTNIYLNSPLMSGETMSSDGTITRASGETETFTPPSIHTQSGTTVIDTDCVVAPSEMTVTFMSTTPQNEEAR